MTLSRTGNAGAIINRAAIEIGLTPATDPFASSDESYIQLKNLLNTVGEELATAYNWEFLNKSYQITTADTDTGDYDLPDDFLFMIPQTGWERANRVPLFGPLSAQDWTYLQGRKLASRTIYASFRLREGLFSIYPQPPPNGLDINFEYQSKNWVLDVSEVTPEEKEEATQSSDVVLFDKVLTARYLKVKFLEAKGLDSTKASDDFTQMMSFLTNLDKSGEIISAGGYGRGFPYLDTRNLPDTGFGGIM